MKRSRYGFGRLTKKGKRLNKRTKQPARVQNAAYMFAVYHGFSIATHATPRGVTIERVS